MDQRDNDLVDEGSPSPTLGSARPKRRSLLPQPGTPKIPVRSIAFSDTTMERVNNTQLSAGASEIPKPTGAIPLARGTSVTGSRLGRLRPRSMYQTGTAPTEKGNEVEKPTSTRSMQSPSLPSKSSAVPSLGLGRTQSLRRPAVTAQPTPSSSTTAHSRTQSTSTVPLARSNTTRPRSTAERPKSVHMPSTSAAQANSGSIQPEPAITRTSTRLAGLSRSASVRTKPDGPSVGLRPLAPAPTRPKVPTKEEPKKVPRPAFSTLQQHFTPRKESKAPTSTFLHPAPITASNSLPPELVSLQLDLLQLHLLHENAEEVSRQWEASAKRQLRLKFDEVASMYQAMLEHERSGQEQKNLQALLEWTGAKASASLVEHIQVLSGPLHELPSLVQTGGRFQRHVAAFEQWISWVEEVRLARESRKEGGLGSIEGLGDAWKAENAALMRKLTSFSRDLGGLSQPAAGSSIASIIGNCESLLDGLLEELRVMQGIEADVVSKEKEWVETRLQGIAADIGSFLVDDEAPAWRM